MPVFAEQSELSELLQIQLQPWTQGLLYRLQGLLNILF